MLTAETSRGPAAVLASVTPVTSTSHHDSEPLAIPTVDTPADAMPGCATKPALAKTAPNAMIVIGLVSVSPTAEA